MSEIQPITSRDNAKIKYAKSVRDGRVQALVFVEGVRLAEEIVRSRLPCREAFVSEAVSDGERINTIIKDLRNSGAVVNTVSEKIAETLSDTKSGQGIVVLADRPDQPTFQDLMPVNGV